MIVIEGLLTSVDPNGIKRDTIRPPGSPSDSPLAVDLEKTGNDEANCVGHGSRSSHFRVL